jgi:hypothetical protein
MNWWKRGKAERLQGVVQQLCSLAGFPGAPDIRKEIDEAKKENLSGHLPAGNLFGKNPLTFSVNNSCLSAPYRDIRLPKFIPQRAANAGSQCRSDFSQLKRQPSISGYSP